MIYRKNKKLIINHKLLFCIICSISTLNNAMEVTSFPNEILTTIFKFSHPSIDLLYNETDFQIKASTSENRIREQLISFKMIQKTKKIAETVINLRSTNKQFNTFISRNINAYLGLNKNNINAFLIRATQAHIPYFMNIALPTKLNPDIIANPNCINEKDGFTPLLYAASNNQYSACKFLIEKGAKVNIQRSYPNTIEFYEDSQPSFPPLFYPIDFAIKKDNPELLSLLLEHGAHLDKNIHIEKDSYGSALYVGIQRNNPYTIALLLNADADKNKGGIYYWLNGNLYKQGTFDIERALKKLVEHNALNKLNKPILDTLEQNEHCMNIIQHTKNDLMSYQKIDNFILSQLKKNTSSDKKDIQIHIHRYEYCEIETNPENDIVTIKKVRQ